MARRFPCGAPRQGHLLEVGRALSKAEEEGNGGLGGLVPGTSRKAL